MALNRRRWGMGTACSFGLAVACFVGLNMVETIALRSSCPIELSEVPPIPEILSPVLMPFVAETSMVSQDHLFLLVVILRGLTYLFFLATLAVGITAGVAAVRARR